MSMKHYILCGLKLASTFDLPELLPWPVDRAGSEEIVFREGPVPSALEAPSHVSPLYQIQGEGSYLLALEGTGRFLVENGYSITVERAPAATDRQVRPVLMGVLQSILWHQRGLLPLHGTALAVDGGAMVLAGPSGAGKSSLAAEIARRGFPVLADDLSIVDASQATPELLPGYQRLRLWQDSLDALGLDNSGLVPAHPRREKYVLREHADMTTSPVPVRDIILLSRRASGMVEIERLATRPAIRKLLGAVHLVDAAAALGRHQAIFFALNALLGAKIRVWRLSYPNDITLLESLGSRVLAETGGVG